MKERLNVIVGTVTVVAIAVGILAPLIERLPSEKELSEFQKKYALVELGDREDEVLATLGEPIAKETDFRLGQRKGFENAYERAEASDSEYYLLWYKGIDVVFTVGINKQGNVSVKEYGGT